jgi:hypothetical protein
VCDHHHFHKLTEKKKKKKKKKFAHFPDVNTGINNPDGNGVTQHAINQKETNCIDQNEVHILRKQFEAVERHPLGKPPEATRQRCPALRAGFKKNFRCAIAEGRDSDGGGGGSRTSSVSVTTPPMTPRKAE